MSCHELERLLGSGAPESERAAHRATCAACEAVGIDIDSIESLTALLARPTWSASLREALLAIPEKTVSCENAGLLIAARLETDSADMPQLGAAAPDRLRLDFHLSRCEGCREAYETLAGVAFLEPPRPAPWVAQRLSASRPARPRARWRGVLDPRAAIGFAYGAAIIVMLAGFNPADLARKAGANLKSETRTAAAAASDSLADRVGAFEDHASRAFAVWRGRVGGYGRAALSNAIALVMRTQDTSRPPTRPRNGEERAPQKIENETAIPTWRA